MSITDPHRVGGEGSADIEDQRSQIRLTEKVKGAG